jgi:hypothetical protein
MGEASRTNGEKRNVYTILVGKAEGKRPLRRPRRRWVDNIKMDLRENGWGVMDSDILSATCTVLHTQLIRDIGRPFKTWL